MNGAHVVVVGSVNVDFVVGVPRLPRPGETVVGERIDRFGGGKGANVAVAAARLGAVVRLVAAVGDDELGRIGLGELRDEGVDVAAVRTAPGHTTGGALIAVDARGENQIAVGSGANAVLADTDVPEALVAGAGCVVVNLEIPRSAVAAAVCAGVRHGVPVVLNPAPARSWVLDLASGSPILTPNRTEAGQLTGAPDVGAAAAALCRATGAPVVVTAGAAGAVVVERPEAPPLTVPAPAGVTAVDTTGAGDAFNGALATRIAAGDGAAAAARFAVAAAACAVRARGARTGMPTAAEVHALLAQTIV